MKTRALCWIPVVGALAFAPGCTSKPCPPCGCEESSGKPIDDALMAFLSKARSIHHTADLLEERDDLVGAIRTLKTLALPPTGTSWPEGNEVMADTLARIADLHSRKGGFDEAEQAIQQGLEVAPKRTYFEGHLHEIRGVNEERRSKSLLARGDQAGADRAKEAAIASFELAVDVQDHVIDHALRPDN